MSGDIEQAIDRLTHAIRSEEDRKIVFLTGSGISVPSVPSTEGMVSLFVEELGHFGSSLRPKLTDLPSTSQYQIAALELKQRRGDRGLAAAIRKGVLQAVKASTVTEAIDTGSLQAEDWEIPPAQRLLGELISKIPPQQLGGIITTNFDSLTEVACGIHNVNVVSLAVPGSAAFPIEGVFGALPVVHLHGFWAKSATLSTAAQLQAERPQIEGMITRLLDKSVLVVLGYGGWDDSFTRSLTRMVRDGRLASLDTEILWLQHGGVETVPNHPVLKVIDGSAGVNTYFGIEARAFLAGVLNGMKAVTRKRRESFIGWSSPPADDDLEIKRTELLSYVQGAQPSWSIADSMPLLKNAKKTYDKLSKEVDIGASSIVIMASPAGEGKSTALRQIALRAARDYPHAAIHYRNPGAPMITSEWIGYLAANNDLTILFVDDADLVTDQIVRARGKTSQSSAGDVIWVVAMHNTYLHSPSVRRQLLAEEPEIVEFESFSADDAESLADAWLKSDILPPKYRNQTPQQVAKMIEDASESSQGRSLFGSILHLWSGDGLVDRVSDLLAKIAPLSISGVSFKDLLSAVAVIQVAWDLEGTQGEGMSLAALGHMAAITHKDVLRMIVEPLGREVGISQVGDRVYVRHPSIAEAIYDILEERGELDDIARRISRSGAVMRYSGNYTAADCKTAYRLSRHLDGSAAIAASFGAIEGAGERLEPRVTTIATLRDNNNLEKASRYANRLSENLAAFADRLQVARGFYVEWSVVEFRLGHLERALGLAVRAISDQVDGFLSLDKLQYGLANIIGPAGKLELVKRPGAADLRKAALRILNRLPDPEGRFRNRTYYEDDLSQLALIREFRAAAILFVPSDTTFVKMQALLREHDRRVT